MKRARVHFILGVLYKKGGFFNDAKREFEYYRDKNPGDAGVYINLGNIEFVNERDKSATEYYRKAESLDPRNPLIYFNLSKAYLSQFRFEEAQEMQNRAYRLDPDATGKLNANHSSKLIRMVADVEVPKPWLMDEAMKAWKSAIEDIDLYWTGPFVYLNFIKTLSFLGFIGFVMLIIKFLSRSHNLSRYCLKCGKPMKPDIKSGGTDHICVSCHMVYFKKTETGKPRTGSGDETSPKKISWDSILHRFLSCVVPGSGRLFSGYLVSGFMMLALWTMAFGSILARPYHVPTYYRIPAGIPETGMVFWIVVLVLDYLVSIRWGFQEEDV